MKPGSAGTSRLRWLTGSVLLPLTSLHSVEALDENYTPVYFGNAGAL